MKLSYKLGILVLIALFGSGCTPHMVINVNSIADKNLTTHAKKYFFSSDMQEVDEKDLYFKEFSGYFDRVLQKNGYTKVAQRNEADFVIKFKYAVSDGRTGISTYRVPIYAHTGGESYTITEVTTDPATGQVTGRTSRTIHIPAQIRYVGNETELSYYTLYNRTATLRAIIPGKEGEQENVDKVLWHIQLYNVSESNDLRQAMPFFAYAATNFLGKNSGQQQIIKLELNDPAVAALRSSN